MTFAFLDYVASSEEEEFEGEIRDKFEGLPTGQAW